MFFFGFFPISLIGFFGFSLIFLWFFLGDFLFYSNIYTISQIMQWKTKPIYNEKTNYRNEINNITKMK